MLQDGKLERRLKSVDIEEAAGQNSLNIIVSGRDRTEKLLKRMEKEGHLIKARDNTSGEETVEWTIRPRGRTKIGDSGVRGVVNSEHHD